MPTLRHTLPALLLALPLLLASCGQKTDGDTAAADTCTVQFVADTAYSHIVAQCQFGPRTPGSEAHRRCGDWIVAQFRRLGLQVEEQQAPITVWDGKQFTCRNIIARYRPAADSAALTPVVLAAHWDSRPWADADPDPANHRKPVLAANDGASGVAVMLEVARHLADLCPRRPVTFVCFDLEDYGTDTQENSFALGAQYWADHLAESYEWGILLDMVGGRDARFCYEGLSMRQAPWLVARTWAAAETAGAGDFFPRRDGAFITDDHGPMNAAGVPTIDIIPFYNQAGIPSFGPTWHTVADTPENISTETLRAVGQTLHQLLYENN
ncbi:MAG: M28 family peptidase [Bacteroidales bacterium]|nr:M28 family peptidase [Candidatus Equimonas faecalis]